MPLSRITRADVVRLLERIRQNRTPQVADHTRVALSSLFSWAIGRGELEGGNPVVGLPRFTRKSDRRPPRPLAETELREFWRALDGLPEPDASALRFQLVTGCRITEALRLDWRELDRDLWTLPAERSKNGRERVTPLSRLALGILDMQPTCGPRGLVFPARDVDGVLLDKPRLRESIAPRLRELQQFRPRVRSHDLRHTVGTQLGELGFSAELIGQVLGHAPATFTERTYVHADRIEAKRRALEAWAHHLAKLCGLGEESMRGTA